MIPQGPRYKRREESYRGLQVLGLRENELENDGAAAIAAAVARLPHLRTLDLAQNQAELSTPVAFP